MISNTNEKNSPLEILKETPNDQKSLKIGIPKENLKKEKRLALTPEAVDMIIDAGHQIILEEGAGKGLNYSDRVYSEAGALIKRKEEVYQSDLIFKIAPLTIEEIHLVKNKTTVCSMLSLSQMSSEALSLMSKKQLNAIGYELMALDNFDFPVRDSIAEIEGAASVFLAAELLNNENKGKGVLLGGVPGIAPIEIVIIGAGVAGTVAARSAMALGAEVKVFDNDIRKLRHLQDNIGQGVFTSVFQPNVLMNAFKTADVVIGAMRYINDPVRVVISEDVIKVMKKGAVLIDLRLSQGGCFETTCFLPQDHPDTFEKYNVLHYCQSNISSRVARTASMSLSNIFSPLITRIGEQGGMINSFKYDQILQSGLYMYSGKMVNGYVSKKFNLPCNDIGLFLSAF